MSDPDHGRLHDGCSLKGDAWYRAHGYLPRRTDDFPFPLREPEPEPMMVSRPCGCTSMVIDGQPVQISWCDEDDPGYPSADTTTGTKQQEDGER